MHAKLFQTDVDVEGEGAGVFQMSTLLQSLI